MDFVTGLLVGFAIGAAGMFLFYRKHNTRINAELVNLKAKVENLKEAVK